MRSLAAAIAIMLALFTQPVFAGVDKGIDVRKVQTMLAELCFKPGRERLRAYSFAEVK